MATPWPAGGITSQWGRMATFLVAHGAWTGGWSWKRMRPLLAAGGHALFTPTYTALGERRHLASSTVDLETHIADMLGVLEFEDLSEVILVGHSYGGMVATGIAARAGERISRIVYLDAFVPADGQCLFDLVGAQARGAMREAAERHGDGWRVPPNPLPSDTSAEDVAWMVPLRVMQPIRTFEQPVRLPAHAPGIPRTYIYCRRAAPGDVFRQFAEQAKVKRGWQYLEMDASHNPHVTAPVALAALLTEVANG